MSTGDMVFLGIAVFFISLTVILIIYGIVSHSKRRKAQREQKLKEIEMGIQVSGLFEHSYGLPLSDGVQLKCYWCNDRVVFAANGSTFNLPLENLIDVCVKSDVEIQKEYVTNTKKAVAGAVLFGTVGAVIGSKPKVKEVRTATPYLIFTYKSKDGNQVKYVALKVLPYYVSNTAQFVEAFKQLPPKENISIDL